MVLEAITKAVVGVYLGYPGLKDRQLKISTAFMQECDVFQWLYTFYDMRYG